ncbi:hypothetical protein PPL_11217 [Heterostelium album PN500]|uniref:DDE Tnp4 domain-containing protein n=1 Tax=Heterostelium pallidum (strain ATCC 26659 / Pp 5 / PN500) TaxID=670386 RepID=D3BTV7_HETP5|nr:hypothetical protein PPL_11217 [Heterostelium album PN500]EFA75143.1 hypothetical protein PPL_11217 [Heterostelium album PN500]|eukprot:XP_020427277.1 hypothetical protein PPL_11217 [Heterostelium album PN500]
MPVFTRLLVNEIDHLLSPSYWMLGDKGYIGGNRIFAPNKKLSRKEPSIRNPNKTMKVKVPFTPEQKAENSFINSNRAVVENYFGRIKKFHCFEKAWRGSKEKLDLAFLVVNLYCKH